MNIKIKDNYIQYSSVVYKSLLDLTPRPFHPLSKKMKTAWLIFIHLLCLACLVNSRTVKRLCDKVMDVVPLYFGY